MTAAPYYDDDPNPGLGPMAELPKWVKIAAWFGLPTVISAVLLAVLLGGIQSPLGAIPAIRDMLAVHMDKTRDQDENQNRLLRQICRNTAHTEIGQDACNR